MKCWRSLMTLARVSWWQGEDFQLKRFTVESAQGQTGNHFFWWQLWYEILLKFFLLHSTTHTLVGNFYTTAFVHAQQQLCKTPDSTRSCELARTAFLPSFMFCHQTHLPPVHSCQQTGITASDLLGDHGL